MDEEPPHPINLDAVEVVLTASLMMNMQPVDEVHVMRKTVIDGSNTTGFQRTCIIALMAGLKSVKKPFRCKPQASKRMQHEKLEHRMKAKPSVTASTV